MEIIKVVLTGGPCAGKTTALNSIKEYLTRNNIGVITVPETATDLILNMIRPNGEMSIYDFQSLVLNMQLVKERVAEEYIHKIMKPTDKCVIIYDRGIVDNKAYFKDKKDFTHLLVNNGLSEIDILDSYDLVLDLLSTARCKKEAYNLFNEARLEDIDTAIEVDKKTSMAWINHRNLKIISSDISLEEETRIIINYIKEIINGKQTRKIRRFLIDDTLLDPSIFDENNSEKLYVTDYFLRSDDEYEHVLHRREHNNDVSYVYGIYLREGERIRVIQDKKINRNLFYELLEKSKLYSKSERCELNFMQNKQKYKLCFYGDYTALEIEEDKLNNDLVFPDNVEIIGEITDERENFKVRVLK